MRHLDLVAIVYSPAINFVYLVYLYIQGQVTYNGLLSPRCMSSHNGCLAVIVGCWPCWQGVGTARKVLAVVCVQA